MKLSEHTRSPVTDARIERQWAALEERLPHGNMAPRRSARMLALLSMLGLAATAGVAALMLALSAARTPLPPGARIESAKAEVAVGLEDGSRVQLAPESQLRLLVNEESAVQLELAEGSAHFDVSHQKRRMFAVKVGAAEIRVIGTRFRVLREETAEGMRVSLRVQEGIVEVRRSDLDADEPRRVRAGETWSALLPGSIKAVAPVAAKPSANENGSKAASGQPEPATAPSVAPSQPAPRSVEIEQAAPSRASASELFRRASVARRAGRMQDAATEYAELLERFPKDSRAGLSAFELGRLRMDALGNPRGAIEALELAVHGRSPSSFHEDALARIVIAYDALAQTESCKNARQRYLARYPGGVHAVALSQRCK